MLKYAADSLKRFAAAADRVVPGRIFLIDGTLLGFVREGDFIPHDTDIDLGIFAGDFREELLGVLAGEGFALERTFGEISDGREYRFRDGRTTIELYLFEHSGDGRKVWSTNYCFDDHVRLRYVFDAFTLAPATFQGVEVHMPSDPQRFLATLYGPRWRRPTCTWDYRYSPRNMKVIASSWRWRFKYACGSFYWRLNRLWDKFRAGKR